jgi:hypothetical protein
VLAHIGLGRAYTLQGDGTKARAEDRLVLALARPIDILPVALRLQLLAMERKSLESIQTEAAPTAP